MDVVFLGTPEFALPALQALIASSRHRVVGVVTQPDRRKGRGRKLAPPPVKTAALEAGLALWQPADVNDADSIGWIRGRRPRAGVVVAFGQFLKKTLREVPALGFINLHASLLPKFRGAAPIHAALRAGEKRTGVSVMQVERRLDAGPVFCREEIDVGADENVGELAARLAATGAPLVARVLDRLEAGTAKAEAQEEAAASHAGRITPEDRRLIWAQPAEAVHNHVRGLTPHPGSVAGYEPAGGEPTQVRITCTRLAEGSADPAGAGTVL